MTASRVKIARGLSRLRAPHSFAHSDFAGVRSVTETSMMFITPHAAQRSSRHSTPRTWKTKIIARDLIPHVGKASPAGGRRAKLSGLLGRNSTTAAQQTRAFRPMALGMSACEVALTLIQYCFSSGLQNLRNVLSGRRRCCHRDFFLRRTHSCGIFATPIHGKTVAPQCPALCPSGCSLGKSSLRGYRGRLIMVEGAALFIDCH